MPVVRVANRKCLAPIELDEEDPVCLLQDALQLAVNVLHVDGAQDITRSLDECVRGLVREPDRGINWSSPRVLLVLGCQELASEHYLRAAATALHSIVHKFGRVCVEGLSYFVCVLCQRQD